MVLNFSKPVCSLEHRNNSASWVVRTNKPVPVQCWALKNHSQKRCFPVAVIRVIESTPPPGAMRMTFPLPPWPSQYYRSTTIHP